MIDREGIKNYVRLFRKILSKHQIVVTNEDLDNLYNLIVLTFELDDLYDSGNNCPDLNELEKIRKSMISLMPSHPISLNAVEIVFKAMDEEANSDLSKSLSLYLSVCGKSIGAQLVTSYLASKKCIELNIWLSNTIVKFNDEINNLTRLANDYLDITVDTKRMSEEVSQTKAINFFKHKWEFRNYIYYRYICHKTRYYLYLIGFKYLNIFSRWREYLDAINCAESVLDFAVKAYINDKISCREPMR